MVLTAPGATFVCAVPTALPSPVIATLSVVAAGLKLATVSRACSAAAPKDSRLSANEPIA